MSSSPRLRRLAALTVVLMAGASGFACTSDDTGACCAVLAGRDMGLIPVPQMAASGEWIDDISIDPAFDCSNLACVAYQGADAYCTRKCEFDTNCPDGFTCTNVLQSDPGPGANIGPNDKFCVKLAHNCAAPED